MPTAPRTILVVDDDPGIRLLLARHLSSVGWCVVSAATAREALGAFAAGRFGAVLADVDLGERMDGVEVARRLLIQDPTLKVVIMSGRPQHAETVKKTGLGAFVAKPFELAELEAMLAR